MKSNSRTAGSQRSAGKPVLGEEALAAVAARFSVLAEPMRLRLLNALRGGELSVTELVEATGAGQANVSKHLGVLAIARMVGRRKEGMRVIYFISDPLVFDLCDLVCSKLRKDTAQESRALDFRK